MESGARPRWRAGRSLIATATGRRGHTLKRRTARISSRRPPVKSEYALPGLARPRLIHRYSRQRERTVAIFMPQQPAWVQTAVLRQVDAKWLTGLIKGRPQLRCRGRQVKGDIPCSSTLRANPYNTWSRYGLTEWVWLKESHSWRDRRAVSCRHDALWIDREDHSAKSACAARVASELSCQVQNNEPGAANTEMTRILPPMHVFQDCWSVSCGMAYPPRELTELWATTPHQPLSARGPLS